MIFHHDAHTSAHADVVKIHYTGCLEDGTEFESTREKEPLEFLVGSGRVVAGIDAAVAGMMLGERQRAHVPCQEAFGYALRNRIVNVSILEIAEEVKVGDRLGIRGLYAVIRSISDDGNVEVDANHPLAGLQDVYMLCYRMHVCLLTVLPRSTSPLWFTLDTPPLHNSHLPTDHPSSHMCMCMCLPLCMYACANTLLRDSMRRARKKLAASRESLRHQVVRLVSSALPMQ